MTIYKKPDLKVFGANAKPTEIAEFEDLLRGWGITIEKTNGIPPMEWFNYLFNRLDGNINYILQNGITEYDTNLEYPQNAVVKSGGKLYLCLRQNTNKPLSNGAYWELLIKSATTSQGGVVQLSNAVDSTDETRASTPKATKTAYDKAVQADNNASTRIKKSIDLEKSNLNDIKNEGFYHQKLGDNATINNNYPIEGGGAGALLVEVSPYGVMQTYTQYLKGIKFWRGQIYGGWTEWKIISNSDTLVRVGSIHKFASDKPQKGYLKCDGGLYSTTTYADLFAEIGYTWGGSGNKFAVPNLTDKARFLRSSGNGLRVGTYQNDAIRNIAGKINGDSSNQLLFSAENATFNGAFQLSDKKRAKGGGGASDLGFNVLTFDASRVVPTADENRPYACVVAYWIKY